MFYLSSSRIAPACFLTTSDNALRVILTILGTSLHSPVLSSKSSTTKRDKESLSYSVPAATCLYEELRIISVWKYQLLIKLISSYFVFKAQNKFYSLLKIKALSMSSPHHIDQYPQTIDNNWC